jgi:hypothetical protein
MNRLVACLCGCGQLLLQLDKDGYERKFIPGHNLRNLSSESKEKRSEKQSRNNKGDKNYFWKGGRYIAKTGYVLISSPDHPYVGKNGYVFEHRLVMEKHLGRYLTENEICHHKNGNRTDNRIENLQLMSRREHNYIHNSILLAVEKRLKKVK